jgi:hypothetical protein
MLSVQHIIPEGRLNSCSSSPGVAAWGWEEVAAWLTEIGMQQYQDSFQKHAIESGRELLQLKEGHLKEMGVGKVGHRLRLCEHLRELRRLAKVTADGVDMDSLLPQLDEARAARFMHRQPKRIILIRHAESVGNVDSSVYAHIPDNKLVITERGRQQAYVSGVVTFQNYGIKTKANMQLTMHQLAVLDMHSARRVCLHFSPFQLHLAGSWAAAEGNGRS